MELPLLWSCNSGLINDAVFSLPGSWVCSWGGLVLRGLLSAVPYGGRDGAFPGRYERNYS